MYDCVVIGCGFAGAVVARELAEKGNQKVLIIEQRDHIGGNSYDCFDEYGILIHQYGPHIFHTNSKKVYEYLSRFTKWYDYSHEVVGDVYGKIIPIPFNLNTLMLVYGEEKGAQLKEKLVDTYGMESRVSILELKENQDPDIKAIADYVYENIFLKYTMKQWGQTPEEVDQSVISRVPVLISYDNRYFQDTYQGMPLDGYTALFEKLLDHENITVQLGTAIHSLDEIPEAKEVIFTGPIDELFGCQYGRLPYRSLHFEFEHYNVDSYQPKAVVNYTVSEDFTRITEFKKLTDQQMAGSTTIMKEYPRAYTGENGQIPYYSVINEDNLNLYEKYKTLLGERKNFHLLGRLAEYKYYNMDAITLKALELSEQLLG